MKCHFLKISFFACLYITTGCTEANILKQSHEQVPVHTSFPQKEVTVLLYGSARNDLLPFIDRNLSQLMQLGSNNQITFLVHLDIFGPGRKKLTQRFIIQKNRMVQVGDDMFMDSGDPATLIDACRWAFTQFPSNMKMLILWNHGTGDLEPMHGRAINPSALFNYNPATKLIELNRSITFLDYINLYTIQQSPALRGICFDEATGHFLTNRQVGVALTTVRNNYLQGKPLDILCCDACLMQGIGFAFSLKPYKATPVARFLVGSQEVVLATGYAYNHMFSRISQQSVPAEDFAKHVVQTFAATYSRITGDWTQSAIWLEAIDTLYENVDMVAQILTEALQKQSHHSVQKFIHKSSAKGLCTSFEEPSYKDLFHLCKNMIENINMITLTNQAETDYLKQQLLGMLTTTCTTIKQVIIANIAGTNLKHASGISIYVPDKDKRIDPSFASTDFAQNTSWLEMITLYMQARHKE